VILVDRELARREEAGRPVRVALVGAGAMGRAVALQIVTSVPGMRLAAIANRTLAKAELAYREAGVDEVASVSRVRELEDAIARGRAAVADDPLLLCRSDGIDVVLEATGDVELGARVAVEAITHGKHLVLMNAELDATLGPVLKVRAEQAGVVYTGVDGDEPGVAMNLLRFVRSIGLEPVLAGNVKGFYDPHRTPTTQAAFAEATGQSARMVTSFADGTKLSMEATLVANATGFGVGRRGMYGHRCEHVRDVVQYFDAEELRGRPLVDFVLGAEPGSGAFVVGYGNDARKAPQLRYFKLGDGPLYVFYRPFHLPHLEAPLTVARAALFGDAAVTPLAGPVCEVVTVAKRDLRAGETLDGIGGFDCYGAIENAELNSRDGLLPMGLSEGCRLVRDVRMDETIAYADVELPRGRLADALRAEQDAAFAPAGAARGA
jgi:predicted homoserine dehydrogenase-like protein